jgi:hypothetical protein
MVLATALAVSAPSVADVRSDGHRGRGRSSEARGDRSGGRELSRGGQSGQRGLSRGRARRSSGEHAFAPRAGGREHADWRRSGARDRGSRGEARHRDQRADARAGVRWHDSGRRHDAPAYRPRVRYRYDRPVYSDYRPRYYYTGSFHRPRFVHRSGFSLGLVIASVPAYGYGYFDPYCDLRFSDLGLYYDHCRHHGHPHAILVLDVHAGYPVAACAYNGGDWVVDDCY